MLHPAALGEGAVQVARKIPAPMPESTEDKYRFESSFFTPMGPRFSHTRSSYALCGTGALAKFTSEAAVMRVTSACSARTRGVVK